MITFSTVWLVKILQPQEMPVGLMWMIAVVADIIITTIVALAI